MPSVFSSSENLQRVNDALAKVEQAMNEAEMAVQAGVPGAEALLTNAKDAQARILKFKNVYFPTGVAPTE